MLSWEDCSDYPDLNPVIENGDMAVKVTLTAMASDEDSEEDFNRFLERFTSNNGLEQHADEIRVITSIPGGYFPFFISYNDLLD